MAQFMVKSKNHVIIDRIYLNLGLRKYDQHSFALILKFAFVVAIPTSG